MTTFTYREIFDALASEGIACRQENMGGGCAALAVIGYGRAAVILFLVFALVGLAGYIESL